VITHRGIETHRALSERHALRHVHREGVLLLGGGRALLMQVAHPAVAAAVVEHSSYRADRLGRLLRTLRPMLAIVFGNDAQALAAASSVRTTHDRVSGAEYSASDPALLAWVLATLIDTSLLVYEQFVGPLSDDLADRYYSESRSVGGLLGMPPEALPERRADFDAYLDTTIAGLTVSADARAIAQELFEPLPGSGPVMGLLRSVTAGLLPPGLRRQYGLSWDPPRAALLGVAAGASRRTLRMIPAELRRPPAFLMP
jgi:uncharacterized protein (DUF2236 family)